MRVLPRTLHPHEPVVRSTPPNSADDTDFLSNGHSSGRPEPTRKLLIYSPDSFGLGHLRRSVNLASCAVRKLPNLDVLIITGSPCATLFKLPERVEIIKLPSVGKDAEGRYVARALSGGLPLTAKLRGALALEVLRTWEPDVVLIDHQPLGLAGELGGMLDEARRRGILTVFGMRDIIDEPSVVKAAWAQPALRAALTNFDHILVYGAADFFDPRCEYQLPDEIAEKLRFTGYIARPASAAGLRPLPALRPQVLVTVGGGEDGAARIDAVLAGLEGQRVAWDTTIILGPLMPDRTARKVRRRGRLLPNVSVHKFYADLPRLLSESDAIVSMAGYNSVTEMLVAKRPAVLLPRTKPRREQALRAGLLAERGLCEALTELEPSSICDAIRRALEQRWNGAGVPPLTGCQTVSAYLEEWIGPKAPAVGSRVKRAEAPL